MIFTGLLFFVFFAWRQVKADNPIIKPTLFQNRGFTSGLILGLIFFAIVAGLNFILSLFLQLGLHLSPFKASLELTPLSLGIILSSIMTPKLIKKLGREIITVGLLIAILGVLIMYLSILKSSGLTVWSISSAIFLMGLGMGFCFGTIYDFAIGDIQSDEAGSASGTLSAVQQLSGSIGIVVMTSIFFTLMNTKNIFFSLKQNLFIILIALFVCILIVRILPKRTGNAEH